MVVEKKFNMFSTREWLQFLQYKLPQEREKELMDRTAHDTFLKEAVDAISTQDNRPVAFQSLSFLIHQIEDSTGVSESKIQAISKSSIPQTQTLKYIGLGLIALLILAGLGYGAYYLMSHYNSDLPVETNESSAQSTFPTSSVDTSANPLEVIPTAAPAVSPGSSHDSVVSVPKTITNIQKAAKAKPNTTNTSTVNSENASKQDASKLVVEANGKSKEKELFEQAQEKYRQNDREGAKQILNYLKSYDNPKKGDAEKILNSIGN